MPSIVLFQMKIFTVALGNVILKSNTLFHASLTYDPYM